MTKAIECINLVEKFGDCCAVDHMNLSFEKGQITVLARQQPLFPVF